MEDVLDQHVDSKIDSSDDDEGDSSAVFIKQAMAAQVPQKKPHAEVPAIDGLKRNNTAQDDRVGQIAEALQQRTPANAMHDKPKFDHDQWWKRGPRAAGDNHAPGDGGAQRNANGAMGEQINHGAAPEVPNRLARLQENTAGRFENRKEVPAAKPADELTAAEIATFEAAKAKEAAELADRPIFRIREDQILELRLRGKELSNAQAALKGCDSELGRSVRTLERTKTDAEKAQAELVQAQKAADDALADIRRINSELKGGPKNRDIEKLIAELRQAEKTQAKLEVAADALKLAAGKKGNDVAIAEKDFQDRKTDSEQAVQREADARTAYERQRRLVDFIEKLAKIENGQQDKIADLKQGEENHQNKIPNK